MNFKSFSFNSALCASGRLLTNIITLVMMPLYLPLLGKEAFGLFSVFITVELFFSILEAGLSSILVKDFSEKISKGQPIHNLFRTFEVIYFSLGGLQTVLCILLVKLGLFNYLNNVELSNEEITSYLLIISGRFLFTSVGLVYDSVINSKEQYFTLNGVRLLNSLLLSVGAYFVLLLSEENAVRNFFYWLLLSAFLIFIVKVLTAWTLAGRGFLFKASFDKGLALRYLGDQKKMIITSFLSYSANQSHLWICSIFFSLEEVGLFALANKISSTIITTVIALTRPLLSYYGKMKSNELKSKSIKSMVLILTVISPLIFLGYFVFSLPVLNVWIKQTGYNVHELRELSLYLLAAGLSVVILRPYYLVFMAERRFKVINFQALFLLLFSCSLILIFISGGEMLVISQVKLFVSIMTLIVFFPIFRTLYAKHNEQGS